MEKSNSNLTPLLKGEIEGDYEDVIKNKNKVLNLIENLKADIETIDFQNKTKESISTLKGGFEELEKNMKKFSQGVSYINSYYKNNKNQQLEKKKEYNENDDDEIEYLKDENLLYSLSQFSKIISNNFQELNKKFENKIKKVVERKNEVNKLSQSFDIRKSHMYESQLSKSFKRSNTREKLKMEQREFNYLFEKSKNILAMSNDIKKLTEENNNLLSHTSTNIDSIENNLINGNEELEKLEAQKVLRNKRYFWIGGGLFIIIVIVLVFIYSKYNSPTNKRNNV